MPRWMLLGTLLVALTVGGCGSSSAPSQPSPAVGSANASAHHHAPHARAGGSASALVHNARPQPSWRPYHGPVPILVYHDLGIAPASEPYPGLYMPYPTFESEIAWLHSAGYQGVTLDEVMAAWFHGATLPAKPIVITFDNGYPPQITEAPRVLSRYGWPGVLNEITQDHLSDAQVRSVLRLGWEVDSHSEIHTDLTTDTPAELHAEVFGSRAFLRSHFDIPADSFCYPSSKYDATTIAAVKAAGYTSATTEGGTYATRTDPFQLPRFEMTTDLSQLQADLAAHQVGP